MIAAKDHTYKELKTLIQSKVLKGDKDSSIVIVNKTDYITKVETMIEERIKRNIRRNR